MIFFLPFSVQVYVRDKSFHLLHKLYFKKKLKKKKNNKNNNNNNSNNNNNNNSNNNNTTTTRTTRKKLRLLENETDKIKRNMYAHAASVPRVC